MKKTLYILMSLLLVSCSGTRNTDVNTGANGSTGVQIPIVLTEEFWVVQESGAVTIDEWAELSN
jgi:hypothetical protein